LEGVWGGGEGSALADNMIQFHRPRNGNCLSSTTTWLAIVDGRSEFKSHFTIMENYTSDFQNILSRHLLLLASHGNPTCSSVIYWIAMPTCNYKVQRVFSPTINSDFSNVSLLCCFRVPRCIARHICSSRPYPLFPALRSERCKRC
jgi:hypothetical protein